MSYSRTVLRVALMVLVGSGIPTSPQAPPSKFSSYERPAEIQRIDWLVLQMNLQVLRSSLDNPLPFIETPVIAFNPSKKRIEAFANVNADELNKLPAGDVRGRLQIAAVYTGTTIQMLIENFDESSGRDFYMQFRGLSVQGARKNLPISTFAEFQDGQIILR
jgi:hypothetical protein